MATYVFPTSMELREIEQSKLPNLMADRPVFEFFPVEDADAAVLVWEQRDNYTGLQAVRGLGGLPSRVKNAGGKRWIMEPGAYGEFMVIDEVELTQRRKPGTLGDPVNIDDLVAERQDQLLLRRLDRIELIVWNLLTTGTFSVAHLKGGVMHTDTYPIQTFTAVVPWGTPATSTPLADFRAVQLKSRGYSVDFGSSAVALMNRVTANKMLANSNNADLYGRRTSGLGTFNNVGAINELLAGDDLPQIRVYEGGYLPDGGGAFIPFIPDDKVVVIGKRPGGQKVGAYRMTRNVNNPNMAPGSYTRVIDLGETQVPREIQVHDGHNGGPTIFWPSSVVVMSV